MATIEVLLGYTEPSLDGATDATCFSGNDQAVWRRSDRLSKAQSNNDLRRGLVLAHRSFSLRRSLWLTERELVMVSRALSRDIVPPLLSSHRPGIGELASTVAPGSVSGAGRNRRDPRLRPPPDPPPDVGRVAVPSLRGIISALWLLDVSASGSTQGAPLRNRVQPRNTHLQHTPPATGVPPCPDGQSAGTNNPIIVVALDDATRAPAPRQRPCRAGRAWSG